MKIFKAIFTILFISLSIAYGADEFSELENIVSSGAQSIQTISGDTLKTALGLLPLAILTLTTVASVINAKRKSENDQSNVKVYVAAAIGGIGGVIIIIFMYLLISYGLTGTLTKAFEAMYDYWNNALQ